MLLWLYRDDSKRYEYSDFYEQYNNRHKLHKNESNQIIKLIMDTINPTKTNEIIQQNNPKTKV